MCVQEIFVRQIQFNIFPIFRYTLEVISYDILHLIDELWYMQMIPVVSTAIIEAIGYDSDTQILQ